MAVAWEDVVAMAAALPEVTESTSYRTPALKVRGKGFARLRTESADGGLMLRCSVEEKEALLAAGGAYYTTPHYDGHGSILVDLGRADADELRELVVEAWRIRAPATLRRRYDAGAVDA